MHTRSVAGGAPVRSKRRQRSIDARNRIVEEHMGRVRAIVLGMKLLPCFEPEDLIQAGVIGLIQAAEKWDPKKNDLFWGYAHQRVRGAIVDQLRRHNLRAETMQPFDTPNNEARRKEIHRESQNHEVEPVASHEAEVIRSVDLARASARIKPQIERLPLRERTVIEKHYFAGQPLAAVAGELHVSTSWALTLRARALGQLRDNAAA